MNKDSDQRKIDQSADERLVNAVCGSQAARVWHEFVLWRTKAGGEAPLAEVTGTSPTRLDPLWHPK
jgi:hypothetical protein